MITWTNTLVYSCECVCFVLLSYLGNVFFLRALCCLMFIDMSHIQKQLMQVCGFLFIYFKQHAPLHSNTTCSSLLIRGWIMAIKWNTIEHEQSIGRWDQNNMSL